MPAPASFFRSGLHVAAWALPFAAFAVLLAHDVVSTPEQCLFPVAGPWVLGVSLLISGAAALLGLRHHRKCMGEIVEVVEAVGHGRFTKKPNVSGNSDLNDLAKSIEWMSGRIRDHVSNIVEEKEKLSAVLDGIWEGVLVLGPGGRIQGVNDAMEAIEPGIRERQGDRPLEVLPSTEFQDACDQLLAGPDMGTESLRIRLDDERCYDVNLVRTAKASGLGLIAVFHDVSEMEQLRSMRSDFAANVSHELRTPLTSIKGYAETLLSDAAPPPEMSRKFLEVILRNANHMGKMIADLLTLSRIESGAEEAQALPVEVKTVVSTAWEAVESMARKRKVTLEASLPGGLPKVLADPDRLSQVFRNLMENAIKFGPEETSLQVGAFRVGDMIRFTVRDFGPGIPKAHQPRIFERFYSVEKHRRNEFGSTGLGLSICRHIVRDMGGEIGLESPPISVAEMSETGAESGTLFHFTIPCALDENQQISMHESVPGSIST